MNFESKRRKALEYLAGTGIWRSNYAPPAYLLLWRLGVRLPPPHFNGFLTNAVLAGSGFAIAFGSAMTASGVFLTQQIAASWSAALPWFFTYGGPAGALFGLGMASYYALSARRYRLPAWRDIGPDIGVEADRT